jgi:hypothetical protein
MSSSIFAPVVLFVYNRPAHTRLTLAALATNSLALESDLIIFSDAPRNANAESAVAAVRSLIAEASGFASIKIVYRDKHLGLARSVIEGVSEIIAERGRVIVVEDDIVTTPNFLAYLNRALAFYQTESKAFSIGAYQFPRHTMRLPWNYSSDTFAFFRACSWGWATWKDRWDKVDWDCAHYASFFTDPTQQRAFNRGGPDLAEMLNHQRLGKIDSWAIRFSYAHFANDAHCIYPVRSLVRNIGLDSTGVHCGRDPRREHDYLDKTFLPVNFCSGELVDTRIAVAFCAAHSPESMLQKAMRTSSQSVLRAWRRVAAATVVARAFS